jgi:hypothetical protein
MITVVYQNNQSGLYYDHDSFKFVAVTKDRTRKPIVLTSSQFESYLKRPTAKQRRFAHKAHRKALKLYTRKEGERYA